MTELSQLVDIAASLSITAKTEAQSDLAARKRMEAHSAIEQEQERLNIYRAVLLLAALYETPGGMPCKEASV